MEPTHLEDLLAKIERLKWIMISVATGGSRIQEKEREYRQLDLGVAVEIEGLQKAGLAISNPNNFRSLWTWYNYWSSQLPTYASRRQYVDDLYANVVRPIEITLYKHSIGALSAEEFTQDLERRFYQQSLAQMSSLQIKSLHPKVIQRCQTAFETRQYDSAILSAFTVVEEEIRARIHGDPTDLGVDLITKAMKPDAPLLVFSSVRPEQEAVYLLYRGAIASFKNPRSHRFLNTTDQTKTLEILIFASLLMRLLDEAKDGSS